jgi:methyltransferase (TIGR00027 family)
MTSSVEARRVEKVSSVRLPNPTAGLAQEQIMRSEGDDMTDPKGTPVRDIDALSLAPVHGTALLAARARALHLLIDGEPLILVDDWAIKLIGEEPEALRAMAPNLPLPVSHWAFRSRYAEDLLAEAVARGLQQYVILGAGLDSFVHRNADSLGSLRVYEVDDPPMQDWKRERLKSLGVVSPSQCVYVPCDFASQTLPSVLADAGFLVDEPAFVSWLGVTQYLSHEAIGQTLRWFGALAPGSEIVLTYVLPDEVAGRTPTQQAFFQKVRASGVPFDTFFTPGSIEQTLREVGLIDIEHLSPEDANRRYFSNRTDGLVSWSVERFVAARVAPA